MAGQLASNNSVRQVSGQRVGRSVREIWFRYIRPHAQRAYRALRIGRARLTVGFHHERYSWGGKVTRLVCDSPENSVRLKDSFFNEWDTLHFYKPRYIWRISSSLFDSSNGVVYLNGQALEESIGGSATKRVRRLKFLITRRAPSGLDGPTIPLGQYPKNYYHWLLEDLPAALRSRQIVPEASLLVGHPQPPYVADSLEAYGLSPVLYTHGPVELSDTILAEKGDDSGWPHPQDVAILRTILPRALRQETALDLPRDFYVSRRGSRRSFRNDDHVERQFAKAGVSVVHLEDFKFLDQVKLFANARTIIAPHGAGLANIVFCPENAKVIEIAPANQAIQCFEIICMSVGCDYERYLIQGSIKQTSLTVAEPVIRQILSSVQAHIGG